MSDDIAVGTVRALFLKPQRGSPMQPVTSITLVARKGIKGDVHQSQLTPRQCLSQHVSPTVVYVISVQVYVTKLRPPDHYI
jgi:hypothetical protein